MSRFIGPFDDEPKPWEIPFPEKITNILEGKPDFNSYEAKKHLWNNFVKIPRLADIPDEYNQKISIVFTNYEYTTMLPYTLQVIDDQDFPYDMYEIIIIDDNTLPVDKTIIELEKLPSQYPDIDFQIYETHKNVTFNINLAFNIGLKKAKYDVVINNPADVFQRWDYLKTISRYFTFFKDRGTNTAISGYLLHGSIGTKKAFFMFDVRPFTDCGLSARREHFAGIGGYCEQMIGWGSNEPNITGRMGLLGVGAGFVADISIAHSLGNELASRIVGTAIPEYKRSHLKEWAGRPASGKISNSHFEQQIANPNGNNWGEIDTLERIF